MYLELDSFLLLALKLHLKLERAAHLKKENNIVVIDWLKLKSNAQWKSIRGI